jgi:hypothetical protein
MDHRGAAPLEDPDESHFAVSMVFVVLQNLTAVPQFLLELRENPR